MIDVKQMSFAYPGVNHKTLKSLDFSVEDGEIFGFLGPSGAGKSTTQKILIGLLKNYTGAASIFGKEVSKHKSSFYEDIGVAFEFPNLYSKLTALENLKLFSSLYQDGTRDPMELLESVGLADVANERVSSFSKGMKMRLNFCRAWMNNPRLVFLDEPTSGLDPGNAKKIRELIKLERNKGATVFLTTHNMIDADDLCDRIAFMVDGELPTISEPKALKLQYGKKNVYVEFRDNGRVKKKEYELSDLNGEFSDIIQKHEIETIHTMEATLEDVFIEVTGRKLQ